MKEKKRDLRLYRLNFVERNPSRSVFSLKCFLDILRALKDIIIESGKLVNLKVLQVWKVYRLVPKVRNFMFEDDFALWA